MGSGDSLKRQAFNGIMIVALVLTMIVSIILEMGLPTASAYIIFAILLAPSLVLMEVSILTAHFSSTFGAGPMPRTNAERQEVLSEDRRVLILEVTAR